MKLTLLGTGAGEGYPGFWCECTNCTEARKLGGKNIRGNGCAMLDQDVLIDMNEHFFEMGAPDADSSVADRYAAGDPSSPGPFYTVVTYPTAMPKECVGMSAAQLHAYISPCFTWLPEMHIFGNRYVEEAIRAVPGLMESAERCRFAFHLLEAGKEVQVKENLSILPLESIHTEIPGYAFNYILRRMARRSCMHRIRAVTRRPCWTYFWPKSMTA